MPIKLLQDVDCSGKIVAIREDLNVPMKDGKVTNDKRIRGALTGIKMALDKGAGVILLSHLGRPKGGEFEEQFSLAPVAAHLGSLLGKEVKIAKTVEEAKAKVGEVVLLENVRFFPGETKNNEELAQKFADLADIYVMDAFGSAHRAHSSTEGALRKAKIACAGPLMAAELEAFDKVLKAPARPLMAIIGGSKVSTKLALLENLLDKVDYLIVGGGIANTFLAAKGLPVGKSLYEPDLLDAAKNIMAKAEKLGKVMPLPSDVITAAELAPNQRTVTYDVDKVPADQMILDIGPKTVAGYSDLIKRAATIVWNGPVGAFEIEPFHSGTKALSYVMAEAKAYVVVGGGDSVAAVESFGVAQHMGYISTGGGAALELLEGKILPSVAALEDRG